MGIVVIIAGIMGAAGIVLAAQSAHHAADLRLEAPAYMLLFHATALLSAAAALDRGLMWRPLGVAAIAGFALGAALFAGDLTLRAFAGHRLFPMAAPTGGVVLIAAWIALGLAGVVAMVRS
jgi:uncharacterized membrane protein YgdD (TMEM256/DUF423 family)